MKKSHLIALLAVVAGVVVIFSAILAPFAMFFGSMLIYEFNGNNAKIEIDSYRLCHDTDGNDIIIIKYLLINEGDDPTCLINEGDFYVYQNGISLSEFYDDEEDNQLPKEVDYDSEDQYRDVKGGVNYYAEIAYELESPTADVQVEINDYGFVDKKKEKVFKIN